jgi:hypothetical protein
MPTYINARRPRSTTDVDRTKLVRATSLLVLTAVLLAESSAHAYNGTEHIRFPDQAYQILNTMRRGAYFAETANRQNPNPAITFAPLPVAPPGVDPARWQTFRTKALAAPALLDNVLVRLSDPTLPSTDCAGAFPPLSNGQHLFECRAGDLPFPPRRYWGSNSNECFLRGGYQPGGSDQNPLPQGDSIAPFFSGLPTNYTGAVIGLWATAPDDEQPDIKVWLRPSNTAFESALRGITQAAADGALAVVFAPIACLGELIFSDNADNCFEDSATFSHKVDPANLGDETVGIAELETVGQFSEGSNQWPMSILGVSLPGLWHFANVGNTNGEFYNPPGIQVIGGGPQTSTIPDFIDIATTAGADLLGITVQPEDSAGCDNYAFGNDGRQLGDWIDGTLGHVEFNPLYNLGQYGWNMFTAPISPTNPGTFGTHGGGAGANGLGWVLHAVGDAMCPHHTIGSLGWGHAPWERFAGLGWEGPFGTAAFQEEDLLQHYPDLQIAMKYAFQWWTFLDDQQKTNGGALPVSQFIKSVATETYHRPTTVEGSILQSDISWAYHQADDKDAVVRSAYGTHAADLRDMMLEAIGASIAFMVKAADSVPATSNLPISPCACPQGHARSGQDFAGNQQIAPNSACTQCGMGVFSTMPNWVDGRCVQMCPADKPTVTGGVCTATGACAPDTPFRLNGTCVSTCCPKDATCPVAAPFRVNGTCTATCSTPFIANYRDCVAACPTGQVPDARDPFLCGPPPTPPSKSCDPSSDSVTSACCRAKGAACSAAADCCSGSCFGTDGLCQGGVGDACVTNSECTSGNCSNGKCAIGTAGQRCAPQFPQGCGSHICPATGACASGGVACTKDSECGGPPDCVFVCEAGQSGNVCVANSDCTSQDCENGTCKGALQEMCKTPSDCSGSPITITCGPQNKCCLFSGVQCGTPGDCCSATCAITPGQTVKTCQNIII